jgi:hypothetical protein
MSSTLHVPSIIIDTLYAEFKREARALCKDLAPVLGVPEKELRRVLIDAVVQTELQVVNVDDLKKQCPVPVVRGAGAGIVELCRTTCILGTSRCAEHKDIQDHQIPIVETERPLTRISTASPSLPTLWMDQETGAVYNPQLQHVGIYKDDSLILFEFKEREAEV